MHLLNAIVDRPRKEAALAVSAAWVAFMAALLIGGGLRDVGSVAIAAVSGALLVFVGFATASRCRRLPHRSASAGRLSVLSVAGGVTLGMANLAANRMIAGIDPALRALLKHRVEGLEAIDAVIASPIMEEIAVRLFLMSGIAWIVFRLTKRPTWSFGIGLVGSAFVFAVLHLARPLPLDPTLANAYRAALVAKYTLAGLPLGWIFWRWGLPYAILCHAAANAAHLAVQSRVF